MNPFFTETPMPARLLLAITMVFALCGLAAAQPPAPPPTAADAEAFVARVEAELVPLNEYSARVSWIGENFITDDTMWLRAKVRAEMARTVEDVLARRTRALFLNATAAAEMAPRVAELLARG